MKSVFIVFNQANTERVEYMLDMLGIRGFTFLTVEITFGSLILSLSLI